MMLGIALVSALPVVLVTIGTANELRRSELALAKARLEAASVEALARHQILSESVRLLFRSILALPDLGSGGEAMDATLASLLAENPFLTTASFGAGPGGIGAQVRVELPVGAA